MQHIWGHIVRLQGGVGREWERKGKGEEGRGEREGEKKEEEKGREGNGPEILLLLESVVGA